VSVDAVLARVAQLNSLFAPQTVAAPTATSTPLTTGGGSTFASLMGGAAGTATATAVPATGTPAGQAMVNLAAQEVGQAEQPPGSNDSPRIAQYRQATAGSGVGPWCSYFVSWAARQSGVPLGDSGQGFGRVDDVWAWAERTGKAIPAQGNTPAVGDLIVWDEHIGMVQSVDPDGSIHTIEGNSSNQVSQRTYGPDGGGAVGYVRLG
jgi:hypothetical protein